MAEQNWFQKILSGAFDQRGGVYVGVATSVITFMAFAEFVTSGFKQGVPGWHPAAPGWYVAIPLGVYAFILGVFVVRKGAEYYMDSRYNSPADKPPEKPVA